MAKTDDKAQQEKELAAIALPVREFCARLSETDRRVELVSAFYATELAAGRTTDTEQNYSNRFNTFINQPA